MIDRNVVASGSYFVVGSMVIGLKVISNNPLDNSANKMSFAVFKSKYAYSVLVPLL